MHQNSQLPSNASENIAPHPGCEEEPDYDLPKGLNLSLVAPFLVAFDAEVEGAILPRIFVRFGLVLGLRPGEARSVQKEWLRDDFRELVMPRQMFPYLPAYQIPRHLSDLLEQVPGIRESGFLFPGALGRRMDSGWCHRELQTAAKAVGLPDSIRFYDLRKTALYIQRRWGGLDSTFWKAGE